MSATAAPKRRRSHAAANDAILHDVSLRMLAERGLDLFSFSDLAKEAGLTRAPIYARYDSPEDLAVEMWQSTLEAELDRILELTRSWFVDRPEAPSPELVTLLTETGPEASALIELMAVARRFSYLQDIVEESLDRRIARYIGSLDVPPAIAVVHLTVVFGAILLSPIFARFGSAIWTPALVFLRELVDDRSTWDLAPLDAVAVELPTEPGPIGDEVLDDFVPAIMRVVARSGYEHASANRISREAGRAFNVVYEQFDSKDDLMAYVVSAWVESGIQVALTPFVGVSGEEYLQRSVAMGRSLVAPINRPFRNLRNEMTLAARHHPTIADDCADKYLAAAIGGRSLFEQHYDGVTDEVMTRIGLAGSVIRSNGFGICLLASCCSALDAIEWTPASAALQRALWSDVLASLRPRS